MEHHSQVVYMNFSADYGLKVPKSKCGIHPKVVENDRAKILWNFQFQTDKLVMVLETGHNQMYIVVVGKLQMRAVVSDVATSTRRSTRSSKITKG